MNRKDVANAVRATVAGFVKSQQSKYFSSSKKGENYEFRADLNSEYREKRKETVKRVIANMTVGKDVSPLFTDVVKNMQTDDIELKKLVYLYLINYARTQPELVILAVNTFVKDTDDYNPLIRALSIRTMGMLRVEKVVDYLLEPLRKGLQDDDPYVRKTAVICVVKMYDLNPNVVLDNGFVEIVKDHLSDRNPVVIANAIAALTEMGQISKSKRIFSVTSDLLVKLLAALNECTEWGQISILNCLLGYQPTDSTEAVEVTERVIPRLQHVNPGVVMAAINVLLRYIQLVENTEQRQHILKKLAPSLVTLLSSQPEIQYIALKKVKQVLKRYPKVLDHQVHVFFTKYNDPIYVKIEKLDLLITLANEDNIDQLLTELREYANEVDIDFVRKSLRALGQCAIKVSQGTQRAVDTLIELLKSAGQGPIVDEGIIVLETIMRAYPGQFSTYANSICEYFEAVSSPEAKASLIWLIGEHIKALNDPEDLLSFFQKDILEEQPNVQLQLITAVVKLFITFPDRGQTLVQKILKDATQNCSNADVRDKAYIYWRLLSANPDAARKVILSEKPPIIFNM